MTNNYRWFDEIDAIINERKANNDTDTSYTARLFQKGLVQIAKKTGEEAMEVALAAICESDERFKNEVADLLFHLMVLLNAKEVNLNDVLEILINRHNKK